MEGLLDFFLWFIPIVILDCFWITDYFKTHEKWRKESFITVIVLNLIFFDIGYFNGFGDDFSGPCCKVSDYPAQVPCKG